jgi:VWFA-related protein
MTAANPGDRPRGKARSGCAVHISPRQILVTGLLLFPVLCTQHSGAGSTLLSIASNLQVQATTQSATPMLDEGKGLIHLDVSVTKTDGEPASDLNREDFELLDEGLPQKILSFHAFNEQSINSQPPVQVILFLDTLCRSYPSCITQADALRGPAGIQAFVRQDNGHLSQPVSVFGISDDGFWTLPHQNSTDGNSLATDLATGKRIVLNRRSDALRALAFIATAQRRKRGRKVMFWIGPGCGEGTGIFPANHSDGRKTFDPIYWFNTLFREARMSVDELPLDQGENCAPGYQLYLTGPRTVHDADDRFLYKKVLAIQSGGSIASTSDLVMEMNRYLRRALNFYTISFDPPFAVHPHEYHSLQVRVEKPGLLARTNTSYYDEPYYSDQPNPSVRHVTVEELEQILRGFTAQQVAQRLRGSDSVFNSTEGIGALGAGVERTDLSKVELTERVSVSKLSDWTARYESRNLPQSLIAVADASAFLDLPAAEILKQPAPDEVTQEHMLGLVKSYLDTTIPKLPDLYATRTTVRYEDTPLFDTENISVKYQPLRVAETSKGTILYRHGNEVVESHGSEPDESSNRYLITHGTFGPLLAEVRRAVVTPGQIKWVRWESGPGLSLAVFEFDVPMAESKDFEGGCCLPDAEGENPFRKQAGYRAEIAIDPSNGTILRLQEQFDMRGFVPMDRDEILIDYGPVKIGGKTYFCPARSVSLARGRSITSLKLWDQSFLTYGPFSTKMNDMRFSNYHLFRAESRILPGFKAEN